MTFLSNLHQLFNGVDFEELIQEIDSLKEYLSSTKKKLSEHSKLLVIKDKEIVSLKHSKESLTKDVTSEINKNSLLERKISSLEQSLTELTKEKEKLKNKCDNITKTNESLNVKNLTLVDKTKALEESLIQLKNNYTSLQSELLERETTISTIRTNFNNLQSELDSKKEELKDINKIIEDGNSEKKVLEEKLVLLQEENQILTEKTNSLQINVDELESENNRIKRTSIESKEKIELLTTENSTLNKTQSTLNEEINNLKEEGNSLQQKIQELQAEKNAIEPYMYLVEDKKKQEAIESAIKEARLNLLEAIKNANNKLNSIQHEEVKENLTVSIETSKNQAISNDCSLEDLNSLIENLLSAIQKAEIHEKKLLEEEAEQKRKETETKIVETTKIFTTTSDDDDVFVDDTLPYIYDYKLIPAEKLSIREVYDVKENKIIYAKDFFKQNESELIAWRRNLQEEYLMGHARFICPECKQPVKISGHKLYRGRVCYFAHFKDSDDCPYKTGTNRTKEEIEIIKYSLVQESERHQQLKEKIAMALKGEKSQAIGVKNVECEKRINSEIPYLKWRRPDIYAEYNGRKYVFELQLSTTFVSVVVDRDIFYRLNNYNIIWVFNFEDNQEYVNLHNLMCKDIYYANKRNVFIFDSDTEEKSKEKGELVLKCRWLDENGIWSPDKYVTLEMFQHDEENNKPFIFDADKAYFEKHPEYVEQRQKLEFSREELLKALMERQKYEEEFKRRKYVKSIKRFRRGEKYGYKRDGKIIIPVKYTEAEKFEGYGFARVEIDKKIGLVRKDGKEIVPVEYKRIDVINDCHGIILARHNRIDLWLGDKQITLCNKFDDECQNIIKEGERGMTQYFLQNNTCESIYSQSLSNNHHICYNTLSDDSKSILFTVAEKKDYCIIIVEQTTFWLSKNHLLSFNGVYSDIIYSEIERLFITKDYISNLWGIIDLQGNIVTDFKYEGLNNLDINCYAFCKDGFWGICDRTGNVLHKAEYTYIRKSEFGELMASFNESYTKKWNCSSKPNDKIKLCLLDDNGAIVYTEQNVGKYKIRHSGGLYSILDTKDKVIINYCLSYVRFVNDIYAIVKNTEGIIGIFAEEKCSYFKDCKNIKYLVDSFFKFENEDRICALGNYEGPIGFFAYCDMKAIDKCHFVASPKILNGIKPSGHYVILDEKSKVVSAFFDSIGDFKDGYADAVYQGREYIIDVTGVMHEKKV